MKNRRGVGFFFIIIITLIVIVSFAGFFQMTFSRQVTDNISDVSLGEVTLLLAESAATEACFRFRKDVNKPGTDAFSALRQEVYGDSTGNISLDFNVPQTRTLFLRKAYSRFSLDLVSVEVIFQKQFSTVPYEKSGIVNCSATVSIRTGLTHKITRTVNQMVEFKVHLTAPPRPFDQVTFFLVNSDSVVSSANYKIGQTISEFGRLARERNEFVALLESEKGSVPDFDFDLAIRQLQSVTIPDRSSIEMRIHEFKTPLTVFTVKNSVDLSKIDLPRILSECENLIRQGQALYDGARATLSSNAANQAAVEDYVTALKALVLAYDQIIISIDSFQDYFAEYSGTAREQLAQFYPKLGQSEWRRKASWYISSVKGSVSDQFSRLIQEKKPLSGVVFVDNKEDVLSLEGMEALNSGNLVVVTTGNVRLSGNGTSPSLLTVISYGTVSVEGNFPGSVIACDRLSMAEDGIITGNLVMNEVKDIATMKGTVKRNPRLHSGRTIPGDPSGAFTDYYYVSVSPWDMNVIERR